MQPTMTDKILFIDNVRSAHNVGSMFRSSDGAGVSKIYLLGTTPTPIDRFGRIQNEIAKTSLGATESVQWEYVGTPENVSTKDALACLQRLREDGYFIVAVEQSKNSTSMYDFKVPEKVVYIVGAEVEGVQTELQQFADQVVEIPMKGMKESLNVSVTAGIVLFQK